MTSEDWIEKMNHVNHFYCVERLGTHLEDRTNKMNYVDQVALGLLRNDLEILEIIKKHIRFKMIEKEFDKIYLIEIKSKDTGNHTYIRLNEREYNDAKRWLENENVL